MAHIWILHSTGLGANRQLVNLAAALCRTCEMTWELKDTLDSPVMALVDRVFWRIRRRIPPHKRSQLRPPWPDLVLIGGGRSLVDALRIRAASGGRSRIVCIGRPGAPIGWVDRVITTPQYRLPEHAKVVHLALPLNYPDRERCDRAGALWKQRFSHLPRPWYGVLLGGDSGSYRYTSDVARTLGQALQKLTTETDGALLITTSPRTPAVAVEVLLAELSCPYHCYRWRPKDAENPLEAIFALADKFVVTADSASMLAEVCSLGRSVASFEPALRWKARLLRRSWLPPWPRRLRAICDMLRSHWIIRGWWVPARDMQRIHRTLQAQGAVCSIDELNEREAGSLTRPDDLERAVAAVRSLLGGDRVPDHDSLPRSAAPGSPSQGGSRFHRR